MFQKAIMKIHFIQCFSKKDKYDAAEQGLDNVSGNTGKGRCKISGNQSLIEIIATYTEQPGGNESHDVSQADNLRGFA